MSHETQTAEQLTSKRCVPCEGGVPKLTKSEIEAQLGQLTGWTALEGPDRLQKEFKLKNFREALALVNKAGAIAEEENHHPDLSISRYRFVTVEIYTHAIDGLSENDFILAAKIDAA